jgi:hypothetical protein
MSRRRAYPRLMQRSRARALLAALAMVLFAASCGSSSPSPQARATTTTTTTTTTTDPPPPAPARTKKPLVPAAGAYFGAWRGPGPGRPEDAQQRLVQGEQLIGRKFAIDHRYYDWGFPLPSAYETWTAKQGRIPMVNLCACDFQTDGVVRWSSIADGSQDAYLTSMAQGFAFFSRPAFLIFDGEPEAKVDGPGAGQPHGSTADYVAAFRHVVDVFRAHGADNVAFVFDTTGYAFEQVSGQTATVKALYPGDDYVDWIAADPYNFFKQGAWRSLSYETRAWYRWARAEHPTKPLALAEWGSKEDPNDPQRKADWLHQALRGLARDYPHIKAVVYFDEEKHEQGTVNDWRIDTGGVDGPTLAAFRDVAHAKYFDVFDPAVRRAN